MKQEFTAKFVARGPKGARTFMPIPIDVLRVFGTKARLSVAGTINGYSFRNSLMPNGDGTHHLAISKELQAGAQAGAGDDVRVVLWRDDEKRVVEVPKELKAAFAKQAKARLFFDALAPSQKKAYAEWISSAKQAETKARRVAKAMEMLAAGKREAR